MSTTTLNWSLFLITFLPFGLIAQSNGVCTGNLGENIFLDGDFGSGTANIISQDPKIAPGYNYTQTAPPNDGFYMITNSSERWSRRFSSWIGVEDNSDDPNGYMMVVNASYEPGLFYEQTIDGLCENTLFEFSADILNIVGRNTTDHIRPNVSFLLDDEVMRSTGSIPQDESWHTYGFTFTTVPGQTSIKLSLRNNAPGGIGNDLCLDNISFRACGPQAFILPFEIANICEDGDPITLEATIEGDQYEEPAVQWQKSEDGGITWVDLPGETNMILLHNELSGGFYYYRYLLANTPVNLANNKCRVISNTKIVHVVPKFYTITDTICDGQAFELGTSSYTQSGTYVDSLLTVIGCDSIVTLNLTVVPDLQINPNVVVSDPNCFGEENGSIEVVEINNGYEPYHLVLTNESMEIVPFAGLSAGIYSLNISDRYGCFFEETYEVVDPELFVIDLGPDTTVLLGESLDVNAGANYEVQNLDWIPNNFPCDSNCLNVAFFPLESNRYKVEATSTAGCVAADSIQINVEENRSIFAPNAFSPNGDGINDYFTIYGEKPLVQEVVALQVFDRWGNLVHTSGPFEPNVPENGWDGRPFQRVGQPNLFVYKAAIRYIDDRVLTVAGEVLLVR